MLGSYPITLRGYDFKVDVDHIGFWKIAANGTWEPETFDVLEDNLDKDATYLDIGAWIGPTVLFASKRCKKVICFEPDPVAYKYLLSNLQANNVKNVAPYNIAIGHKSSISRMSSLNDELGDSMTSLLANHDKTAQSFEALVMNWNEVQNLLQLDKVSMIKIDVEGAEFDLLPAMSSFIEKYQPTLYLSIHPELVDESKRKEELLKLAAILKVYKKCFNEQMEQIEIEDIASDKNLLGYPAYLFKN
jgi:FkbM family methyltransferase